MRRNHSGTGGEDAINDMLDFLDREIKENKEKKNREAVKALREAKARALDIQGAARGGFYK